MDSYLQIFVAVVTLAVAGYAVYAATKKGETVTLSGVVENVKEAVPIALQAKEVVQIAVNTVEQLKRDGSIKTNDEAFNHALNLSKKWLPAEWQVSNEDIINFINAAVLTSSALAKQAGVSSEHGKAGPETRRS